MGRKAALHSKQRKQQLQGMRSQQQSGSGDITKQNNMVEIVAYILYNNLINEIKVNISNIIMYNYILKSQVKI